MKAVLLEDGTAVQAETLTDAILMADVVTRYPRLQGRLVTATIVPQVEYVPFGHRMFLDTKRGVHQNHIKGHKLGYVTRFSD